MARYFERVHYRKIAEALKEARADNWTVLTLANMLEADAPQFDRVRFYIAAGVKEA